MLTLIYVVYWTAVFGLFAYGVNCYVLMRGFRRHRSAHLARLERIRREAAGTPPEELPRVAIQLPVYNERLVVGRLIHAVCRIDYPRDRLEIQVLDDSTDDTRDVAARLVEHFRCRGFRIEHIRRSRRDGFKAGALAAGLERTDAELVAIFDADFVPPPDFLHRTVPFFRDPSVGLVQARWGHLNPETNWLTRAQAIAIDGHFGIEQAGRAWSGYPLNFNGTAGIWRRRAIDEAGGWSGDTLTEDLDLSYRAQLAGWRIEYVPDVEVPAELPVRLSAFKAQQRRWAKGSIQTAMKLLPRVWRARARWVEKIQATLHLTHYLVHPLMLAVAVLSVPLLAAWRGRTAPLPFAAMVVVIALATAGPTSLYVASQRALRADWRRRIAMLPVLMVLGTGIAVSNTRAVVEAILRIDTPFVRTPKESISGDAPVPSCAPRYRVPIDAGLVFEAVLAAYCTWGLALYVDAGRWLIGPYLALYAAGFGTVAAATLAEAVARRFHDRRESVPASDQADPIRAAERAYGDALGAWNASAIVRLVRVASR